MDKQEIFVDQLVEMYQGEVIGEVLFNAMLTLFPEPDHQYKTATMLQLETETKARLRPALLALGASLLEEDASRDAGDSFVEAVRGKDWAGAMAVLSEGVTPYVERYREVANTCPDQYKEIANLMVEHEESLYEFVTKESQGDGGKALERIIKQLHFPLPKVSD
ncbi:MAG: hypothetical protein ACU84Q_01205 [Gammaproteobacteria bacterium]